MFGPKNGVYGLKHEGQYQGVQAHQGHTQRSQWPGHNTSPRPMSTCSASMPFRTGLERQMGRWLIATRGSVWSAIANAQIERKNDRQQ